MDKLPLELQNRLNEIYTKAELEIIDSAFNSEKRTTSFRVNTLKTTNKELEKELQENWLEYKKVDFLKNWYILINGTEKDLWDLDIFKQGKIYLQSVSSQLSVNVLDLKDFDKVLDVTAAPGWKTSQASAILKNTWEIVANDNNSIRIDKLNFTLKRQWCRNVNVIKTDARLIWEKNPEYIEYFDKIIADLPCSAEWKINLNKEKSYSYWNMWVVKRNFKLQKEIIKSVIPLLKSGWELVYSTCTLAPEENEAMVHMILSCYPELEIVDMNISWEYIKPWLSWFWKHVYRKDVTKSIRVLPSTETEWFFVAKFKKTI